MIAIEISRPGGPDVLRPVERPVPVPADHEVLIHVFAAGVNRPDVMQREGRYPPPAGASDLPGLEVAGIVETLGPCVVDWRVGDRVCALVSGGGYAEYCVAPVPQCLPIPFGVRHEPDPGLTPFVRAAAIPEAFFTVWTNVFARGALTAGETALVHGGTSGIGTTAIQLAAVRGARVFATAGTDDKCRACERLGAERGINYHTEDFVEGVRARTGGRGVDLILDIVGGGYVDRNLQALAQGGRLVQIGLQSGSTATVDLRPLLARRLTITGSTLRARSVEEKGAIAAALRDEVWPLLERGLVTPIVYRTFPLTEAAEAHRLLESGEHIGKIVLVV